jgi:hypothetical protein
MVEDVKPPALDAPIDRPPPQSEREELPPRDHPMLAQSQLSQLAISSPRP